MEKEEKSRAKVSKINLVVPKIHLGKAHKQIKTTFPRRVTLGELFSEHRSSLVTNPSAQAEYNIS